MSKIKIAKIAGLAVGATVAFGSFVPMAGAVTVAELQAQINALMAQLASLQGGTGTGVTSAISSDLTVGSSGTSVVVLQQALVAQGYLTMPAGVAMGYFGSLTKAAVMKWQAANGVPATGYFGPISRAKFNGSAGATGTVPGTTIGGGSVSVGVITTPGVEGTLTVSENASPASGTKLYEGSTKVGVLGIKLEAKTSDIKIERVKLDLDCVTACVGDSDVYRKIAQKIYIMDGSTVLGSMDLNVDTVVEDGSDRFITVSGLSFVVPKDATKVLTVALDARSTWDSAFDSDTFSVGVPVEGVRGVDGAGVNQYGPATAFSNNFTAQGELVDSATLSVSLNAGTPATQQVICEQGTDNDECDNLEVGKIDFRAEKDSVTVTDFVVDIVRGGAGVATATTAYLYDGSTLVGSATVAGTGATTMTATFSDIDWVVPKDTTKTLSVKLDVDDAALAADTFVVSTDAADVTAENSAGTAITATGSADAKTITIRNIGPELTLLSKSITTSGAPQSDNASSTSTSTLTAIFNVRVKAMGADLYLGKVASTSDATQGPAFSKTASTNSFQLYADGAVSSVNNATSTDYTIPSTCVDATPANTCTLAEGASVDIAVTYLIPGRTAAGAKVTSGLYAVELQKFNWAPASTGAIQSTSFMDGLVEWRTSAVSFP